jgi:hypothetical protein
MEEMMNDLEEKIADKVREISECPGGEFFDLKNFFQEKNDDGYSVGFIGTNSCINVDKDGVIHAKSGGIENDNVNQLNEFINTITQMPNTIYKVNDFTEYCTDSEGRVIEAIAYRTDMNNNSTKILSQRDRDTQIRVRTDLNGSELKGYDGGHIFSNSTNGCNNTINQVPMPSKYNKGGKWRKLENQEEKWLNEGKHLVTKRKIIYKEPGSKVVKSIITTNIVDEKTMPDVIVNFLITKN